MRQNKGLMRDNTVLMAENAALKAEVARMRAAIVTAANNLYRYHCCSATTGKPVYDLCRDEINRHTCTLIRSLRAENER